MSALPQTLGSYQIIAELGRGGMARVLLAMRCGPGGFRKLSVVKQLRPDLDDPAFVQMFLDEARLAALLSHRNVIQSHEVTSRWSTSRANR
jgi:serine/threonine-protein kinase